MSNFEILSMIWKNKSTYDLIEDITIENKFIQQTSGSQNLWKTQLGLTENYVVFLKPEVRLGPQYWPVVEDLPSRLLIHMAPKNTLKVRNCTGRKLAIQFPTGFVSYFKLPLGRGSGTAWSRWRNLKDDCCSENGGRFPPKWTLISLADLEPEARELLERSHFMKPVPLKLPNCLMKFYMFLEREEHSSPRDSWVRNNGTIPHDFAEETDVGANAPNGSSFETEPVAWKQMVGPVHEPQRRGGRKSRIIARFGEGIPEGCTFGLSLSYEDTSIGGKDPDSRRLMTSHGRHTHFDPYLSDEELKGSKEKVHIEESVDAWNASIRHFPNVSSVLIPPRSLNRSISDDSVSLVGSRPEERDYLVTNSSLPNLDELVFHRRNHRLSYASDFEDEDPDLEGRAGSVSFWMPKPGGQRQGRIYTATPLSRKLEALRYKAKLLGNKHG